MPVDDLTVVDIVAISATTGEAVLVIADHLQWDERNEHLLILQNKINAYLEGLDNGSIYAGWPEAKNRKILIEVKAKYEPNQTAQRFFGKNKK